MKDFHEHPSQKMSSREKDDSLSNDIREDLKSVRHTVIRTEDISCISMYDFQGLDGMYKNFQQQISFIRKIYKEIVQEILEFISGNNNVEAMINLCVLEEIFDSQKNFVSVDIEIGLNCVETINEHIREICKSGDSHVGSEFFKEAIRCGVGAWNNLKIRKAILVSITPFLDDNKNLIAIEKELEEIFKILNET